jgi:ankyrin repeat protein
MGVFFTNYQVHTKDAVVCAKAVADLVQFQALVSDADAGWVSVYDENSESQNDKEMERLAKALSSKLATEVFAFLLHDSDVFMYWLYRKGKLVDRFNSRPDYFRPVEAAERKKWAGDFSKLLPIAAAGTTVKKIQQLMARKRVFEEELARQFAKLMGMNPERACTGFKYLRKSEHKFTLVHGKGHSATDSELAESVESGNAQGVRSALEKHASPDGKNTLGESLLVSAVRRKRVEIAALLLEAGADPFADPKADALWAAATHGNREILQLLLRKPSEKLRNSLPAALTAAVLAGHAEIVEDLLKAGADPNLRHESGTTPLLSACSRGTEFVAEILTGRRPQKPTDWAAVVKMLIQGGADVNVQDKNGMTPLFVARATGQKEIAELLLQAGADPNAKPGPQFLKMIETLKAAGLQPGAAGAQPGHPSPQVREIVLRELMKRKK